MYPKILMQRLPDGASRPSLDILDLSPRLARANHIFATNRIMSRNPDRQTAEIQIRIAIMNRCSALGRAEIEAVA